MFQSRNRDTFDFKSGSGWLHGHSGSCFNLVIEILLISRHNSQQIGSISRILFQSRNRDTFDFKRRSTATQPKSKQHRFNLVIEILLISRNNTTHLLLNNRQTFQSRNRDTFDFKNARPVRCRHRLRSFNLVIEILLISSTEAGRRYKEITTGFNLVIEILLISRPSGTQAGNFTVNMFQSRNRDTFDFKGRCTLYPWNYTHRFNLVIEILLISRSEYLGMRLLIAGVSIS